MVIDTCIFIEHLRAKDRTATTLSGLPKNKPIYISVVTLFELYCGAYTPDKKRDIVAVNVTNGSLGVVLGRFKSHTSKKLFEMIANNVQESRRGWMIKAFERAGKYNSLNENHQFWQNGNYPVLLYSPAVIEQKIDYTHENPVRAGFVGAAHEYWYSSANPESPLKIIY